MSPFPSRSQRTGTRGAGLALALALAASLTGCGPADTGVKRDTAHQLQELVLAVSQASASNDHATALKTLDSLESDVASASGSGHVSEERRRSIMTSITAVRADLNAAAEHTAAAAKAAEEAAAAAAEAEKAKADAEAAAQAATANTAPIAQAPVPAQAPAPAPAPAQGKGNKGKGKNGNG